MRDVDYYLCPVEGCKYTLCVNNTSDFLTEEEYYDPMMMLSEGMELMLKRRINFIDSAFRVHWEYVEHKEERPKVVLPAHDDMRRL